MTNCKTCEFHQENMGVIPVRTKKGMMQPGKEYCEHFDIKHKVISRRAKGSFSYPLWCPIGNFSTCDQCGTKIRIEEGCYCKRCR